MERKRETDRDRQRERETDREKERERERESNCVKERKRDKQWIYSCHLVIHPWNIYVYTTTLFSVESLSKYTLVFSLNVGIVKVQHRHNSKPFIDVLTFYVTGITYVFFFIFQAKFSWLQFHCNPHMEKECTEIVKVTQPYNSYIISQTCLTVLNNYIHLK